MHAYTQHERSLVLSAVLDITLDQFFDGIETINELPEHDPVNTLGGLYVGAMQGEPDPQLMMQALASMSDDTMHRLAWHFGDNPLDFEPTENTDTDATE